MTQYFEDSKDIAFFPKEIKNSYGLQVFTAAGVFSPKRVDKGTEILIDSAIIPKEGMVLDLGCGYGIVGLVIAHENPHLVVVMSDVNPRCVKLARMNVKKNNLTNARVVVSDGFANVPEVFDTIVQNPPQAAGKDVCLGMIRGSFDHLKTGGSLQIVGRHNVGGRSLEKMMKEIFKNVEVREKKSGYWVYVSRKITSS